MGAEREALEALLGHRFNNGHLLSRALTHKSYLYERNADGEAGDNEQLEFLGDAILGFIVSDILVRRHPAYPEGRLSKLKAHLVSSSHLYEVALRLRLGDHLLLGRGEEMSGGREKRALLSDAAAQDKCPDHRDEQNSGGDAQQPQRVAEIPPRRCAQHHHILPRP